MNRKILVLLIIALIFSIRAFARDGRVDFVAVDGRFVIYGDYTKLFEKGDKAQVKRDGRVLGIGEVTTVYPTYMMLVPFSMESGSKIDVGDLVERIGAGGNSGAANAGIMDGSDRKAEIVEGVAQIERVNGNELLSYGDFTELGMKAGTLVEIVRGGRIIGAAEVLEAGVHLAKLKLVGTAGEAVREGDSFRVPPAIMKRVPSIIKEVNKEEKEENEEMIDKEEPAEKESGMDETKGSAEKKIKKRADDKQEKEESDKQKKKGADPIEKRLEELKK